MPIPGAEIALIDENRSFTDPALRQPELDAPVVAIVESDSNGSFSLRRSRSGRYRLRVRLKTGEEIQYLCPVQLDDRRVKVRLVLGSGALSGTVHTPKGAPQPGIVLRLIGKPRPSDTAEETWRETDRDGRFRFVGLTAGKYDLFVGAASARAFVRRAGEFEQSQGWPSRAIEIDLAEAESWQLDAGSTQGATTWSGCIRTPGGDLYAKGKVLLLERERTSPRGSRARTSIRLTTARREGFQFLVEPGEWRVSVEFPPKDVWKEPVPLLAESKELARDLVVPGTRIKGRVIDMATGESPVPDRGTQHVRLRRFKADADRDPDHDAVVQRDGSYALLVHGDGAWVLTATPFPVLGTRKRLDLQIDASKVELQLDVQVQKP